MKVTTLLENTTKRPDLSAEHGLSLYLETAGRKILFDMGQTDLFSRNASVLGIDLAAVEIAVLSHGHYDHGGGLARFLALNHTAPVYVNRHAFEPHYHGSEKYIGLDTALMKHGRLVFTEGATVLADGITLCSCQHSKKLSTETKKHDLGAFGLTVLENGVFQPEDFRHEQYLLVEENHRKILLSGCSHRGILDIVDWFRPDILIGGFHFSKLPLDDTLKSYAEYLDRFPTQYYTCHCTGEKQFAFMKNYMRNLHRLSCGDVIQV